MIIKLRHPAGTFEPDRCLECGVLKADPTAPLCQCCGWMLVVLDREWFIKASEESLQIVQDGIDQYMKEHEPISREWTKGDRDFLKALMIGVEP